MKEAGVDAADLERGLQTREPRLPRGLSAYIRRLKQEGKLAEAMQVRREALAKKTGKQKLQDKLNESVRDALLSSDPKEQVVGEFTATLILALQEGLPLEQRAVELETVYRNHPEVSDYLEGRAVGLVHEISVLLKGAES